MKHRLLLILCLTLPFLGNAQGDTLESLRQWRLGPLTWNDFKVVSQDTGDEHSYIEFFLTLADEPERHDDITVYTTHALAYVNRSKSWVDSFWRTPLELHYNQVIFDLVELYRRYMQSELDTGGTPDVGEYMELLVADVDQFCRDSRYGTDSATVERWDDFVHDLMVAAAADVATSHADAVQAMVTPSNYETTQRFGFGMGAGIKTPTGSLSHYVRSGGGFYMDCEFGYSRQFLNFGLYIGGSRCLDTMWNKNDENNDLYRNDRLTVLDFKLDYGIAVIDNNHIRLMPFVGIGMLGYYTDVSDDYGETTSVGPTAFSWRAGLDFRYHFSTDLLCYQKSCEVSQFSLFAKLYAEPARFQSVYGEPHGVALNLIIGLAFHESTRLLK